MIEKVQVTDTSVIEQVRVSLPIATTNKSGLYSQEYVTKSLQTSESPNKLIKLFSCKRRGFSGKVTVLFRRGESTDISEFSIYSNAYQNVEGMSIINIYKRSGSVQYIKYYHDGEYVYAYIGAAYHIIYCKLDFIFSGEFIWEEQTGIDISTLTEISFTE
ncbi:hypothetical protein [Bacteroides intestinalis]|jgi:hypothetical protein|uniref:Uncharacterized protein n=3 Tax=Bacteroides intestinalis TaxID=329854 RepID=A0A6N2U3Q1_9BACE|nr:hypothetical protein [Bacteroides intestinalis]DAU34825.1 MAG TPA: hypothetical protein [Caudoviricetes sp.]MCB6675040.1 hypothetical protein [Bacteroides intestinalis]MCB7012697.1 hypothetical protein [Bacteroides intestinalis]MCG4699955.1 hypothetical protein [Bacteroides intestinalis]MCG4716002.1 hypothetical protein [Bacteroides intestinalis]